MAKQAKFIRFEYPSKITLLKRPVENKYEDTQKQITRLLSKGWTITAATIQEQGVKLAVLEREIS